MTRIFNEEEFTKRIARHYRSAQDKKLVIAIWKGYLAGIYEWGIIDLALYTRLDGTLPAGGDVEIFELFTGEPVSDEARSDIESHAAQRGG